MKIAKVSPILKGGNNIQAENYRPMSVLPIFSKILEKIMYNRVYNYFAENNLLFPKEFDFQINTSTEHAILESVRNITKSFEKNEYVLGVFIDLMKAFDTVNHETFLHKLMLYGANGKCLEWFKSYLSNRYQCIVYDIYYNIKKSVYQDILCGVPQGSILGPLLFLIYVNDLYKCSEKLTPVKFADDTNLFLSGINVDYLFSDMNCELNKISLWFKANKLSLNLTKTKYSLFHPASKRRFLREPIHFLKMDNIFIERENVTKFLGVLIDENLSWKQHINDVSTKISKTKKALVSFTYLEE